VSIRSNIINPIVVDNLGKNRRRTGLFAAAA